MNVYLDDNREGPRGPRDDGEVVLYTDWNNWVIVRSTANLKVLLSAGVVENLSLDHDLGNGNPDGSELVRWMAGHDTWPKGDISVHSANSVGAKYMKGVIDRYRYGIVEE